MTGISYNSLSKPWSSGPTGPACSRCYCVTILFDPVSWSDVPPSLSDMGRAIGSLVAQRAGDGEECVLLSEEHSLVLTCCWVALKVGHTAPLPLSFPLCLSPHLPLCLSTSLSASLPPSLPLSPSSSLPPSLPTSLFPCLPPSLPPPSVSVSVSPPSFLPSSCRRERRASSKARCDLGQLSRYNCQHPLPTPRIHSLRLLF